MPALEILSGKVVAPGSTFTGLSMFEGNSLTIRNAEAGSRVRLIQLWVDAQLKQVGRLRSPLLHDNVEGIRFRFGSGIVTPLLPPGQIQALEPQDTLVAELQGSTTTGNIETMCLLVHYENLPGIDANLISPEAALSNMVNVLTVENIISTGASGGYSGAEAINAESDLLHANTDYAILGYTVDTECACVRYSAAGFGNLGLGGPGNADYPCLTRGFFTDLSAAANLPLVPVFNSADRANVLVDVAQDENGADVVVTTYLAELPKR